MIKHLLGIAAGKGGVGKSTVTANLALAFSRQGKKVGVLDADLYGPSIPHMLPEERLPEQNPEDAEKIFPAISQGIKTISMAYFRKHQEASILRAPIANAAIRQFLHSVEWGDLDILLIDFPPGTGDIQLSLAQQGYLTAALVVTLPQMLSLIDVRKAASLFEYTRIPLLGIVENMQGLFPGNAGEALSQELGTPLLASIPYDPLVCTCADEGKSLFDLEIKGLAAKAFEALSESIECELARFSCAQEEVNAFLKDSATLSLEWADGLSQEIDLGELQEHCPCIRCQECPGKIERPTYAKNVTKMGRYALSVQFATGCSRGIYPIKMLRAWRVAC
ncbi:MAG: P-loop NTPase [Simkania sp.]|nr:P-loop NTPase [Simkania sp.]